MPKTAIRLVVDRPDPALPGTTDRRLRERDRRFALALEVQREHLTGFEIEAEDHVAHCGFKSAEGEASDRPLPYVFDLFEHAFAKGHSIAGVCNADVFPAPKLGERIRSLLDRYDVVTVTRSDVHRDGFEELRANGYENATAWANLDPTSSCDLVVLHKAAWEKLREVPELRKFAFAESHWDSCLINVPPLVGLRVRRLCSAPHATLWHLRHPGWWTYRGPFDLRAERIYQDLIVGLAQVAETHKAPNVHLYYHEGAQGIDLDTATEVTESWAAQGWTPHLHGAIDLRFMPHTELLTQSNEIARGREGLDYERQKPRYYHYPVLAVHGGWYASLAWLNRGFSPRMAQELRAGLDLQRLTSIAAPPRNGVYRPSMVTWGLTAAWRHVYLKVIEHRHMGREFQLFLQGRPESPLYASTTEPQLFGEWFGPVKGLEKQISGVLEALFEPLGP
jgi:hypothetical protein